MTSRAIELYIFIDGTRYNLTEWVTIKNYAEIYGLTSTNVVSNWIKRGAIHPDFILEIPELNGLKLVRKIDYK